MGRGKERDTGVTRDTGPGGHAGEGGGGAASKGDVGAIGGPEEWAHENTTAVPPSTFVCARSL